MKKENTLPKTFADFGLIFTEDSNCATCNMGSCHNNVTSKKDGLEYNVHISVDFETGIYYIHATENGNFESPSDLYEVFGSEPEAVSFVCVNFDWFKCF